jgi:hypothetical protein
MRSLKEGGEHILYSRTKFESIIEMDASEFIPMVGRLGLEFGDRGVIP